MIWFFIYRWFYFLFCINLFLKTKFKLILLNLISYIIDSKPESNEKIKSKQNTAKKDNKNNGNNNDNGNGNSNRKSNRKTRSKNASSNIDNENENNLIDLIEEEENRDLCLNDRK